MKKTVVLLVAITVVLSAALVSPAMAAIEVEGDAYVGVFDKYLWRGFDLSGSEAVAQGGVDVSAGNFTLSYWTNVQLNSDDDAALESGEATENDFVIDYSFDVNDLVSVSVGNIYYMLDGYDDTNELYLGVSLNTILEPSLTVYYDWDECEEDGLFYTLSVGHGLDVTDKLSLGLGALLSYNQENDFNVGDYSDWHNLELSLGVDYAVTDQITISPSFLYSEPMSDDAEDIAGIEEETLVGVTVTLAF